MKTSTTFVALSVTTITVPSSRNTRFPEEQQIAGIGLLMAQTRSGRHWRFRNHAIASGAGERDDTLLDWLAVQLPQSAIVIGYQLDSRVMPLLTDAAANVIPTIARSSMISLGEAMRSGPVDLAIGHGGAAAPPLVEVAADHGIGTPATSIEQRLSDWSFGDVSRLRAEAADEALALWMLFLRKSRLAGLEAEAATEEWIRRRKSIRVVAKIISGRTKRDEAPVRWEK